MSDLPQHSDGPDEVCVACEETKIRGSVWWKLKLH